MAADRDQVRLGKNLEQVLALQQAQGRPEIEIGSKCEQVQQVAYGNRLIAQLRAVCSLRELQLAEAWKLELLCRRGADQFVINAEEVCSELSKVRTIHRGELDLQHHLPAVGGRGLNQVHHRFRMHRGDRCRLLCDFSFAHDACEKDGILAARDFNLLAGECSA